MIPIFVIPLVAVVPPAPTLEPPLSWRVPLAAPFAMQEPHTVHDTYIRVNAGFVTTEDSDGPGEEINFDEGYLIGLAIGRRMGANDSGVGFSLELEGVWDDQDADDTGTLQAVTDVSVLGVLLNGVVDFRASETIGIYAGAGIGTAWLDVGTTSDSVNDFDDEDGPFLAWQLKAGIGFHLSPSTELSVGYRFLNIDDAEIDDGLGDSDFDLETQQHVLEVGLTFGL